MAQAKLAKLLKAIMVVGGLCAGAIYLFLLPYWGNTIVTANPEFSHCFWPWVVFLWLTGIPCFWALTCGYKIASAIGQDHSFSVENARRLKTIAILAAADSIFLFAGNLLFLLLNMNHPGVVLGSFFISFIGFAITIAAACLSHLVYDAAKIREENELTI